MPWTADDEEINGVIDANLKSSPPNPPAVNTAETVKNLFKAYWSVVRGQVESAVEYIELQLGLLDQSVTEQLSANFATVDARVIQAENKADSVFNTFLLADGLGTYNASTNVASIKDPASTFTPTAVANQLRGKYFNVVIEGTQAITGTSVLLKVGGVLISRGTKWDYIPPADTGFQKITEITHVSSVANLITSSPSGYWASGATLATDITASSSLKHTNQISVITGDILIFEGLGTTSLALNIIGKIFTSAGALISNVATASLVAITGGYKYTVPTVAAGTTIGFNLGGTESPKIYKGSAVIPDVVKINDSALPTPKVDLSEFTDSGNLYAKKADTITDPQLFDTGAVPPNLVTATSSGYYASSGVTKSTDITTHATIYHTNLIGCDSGNAFAIKGLTTSLSLGSLGKFFDASLNVIGPSNITTSLLTDITGGKKLVIPSGVGIAFFAMNINLVDAATLKIQSGGAVIDTGAKTIKPGFLPTVTTQKTSDDFALEAYNRGSAAKPSTVKKYGILFLGQSNADGRVDATEQPQWFIDAGRVIAGALFCNNANGTFANYSLSSSAQFSFELYLYKLLLDYLKTKYSDPAYTIYSVKRAQGGTPISELASGAPSGYWNPFFEKVPSGNVLLQEAEARVRKAIELQGNNFSVRAIVWHQGESDSTGTAPDAYYANLKCVIAYLRGVLDNPKLPFIIGGINTSSTQYNSVVNAACRKIVTEDKFVFYAEVGNTTATLKPDILHFNAAGAEPLATTVFNIIKDF